MNNLMDQILNEINVLVTDIDTLCGDELVSKLVGRILDKTDTLRQAQEAFDSVICKRN